MVTLFTVVWVRLENFQASLIHGAIRPAMGLRYGEERFAADFRLRLRREVHLIEFDEAAST